MTEYVQGRGRLTERHLPEFTGDGGATLHKKDLGRAIAREGLEVMASLEGMRVGAV